MCYNSSIKQINNKYLFKKLWDGLPLKGYKMAKVTMKMRKEKLAEVLKEALENGEITEELSNKVTAIFGSVASSVKVNDNGEIFCNYFGMYLPADQFHVSAKGKIDSMSVEGKRLNRTQKSMVNKATSEVIKQFRDKEISSEEMENLLATIDENTGHKFPVGTATIPNNYPFSME